MGRIWSAVGLAVFVAGCGIISGLDGLGVTDATDASCATCTDAGTNIDVVPPIDDAATDSGDANPLIAPGSLVACGQFTCKGQTPYCCRSSGTATGFSYNCIPSSQACLGLIIRCDSQDDCASGQVCCFGGYADGGCVVANNVQCAEPGKCTALTNGILCNDAGQCASKQSCSPSACSLPGYDVCK